MGFLTGKKLLITGVLSNRSIAYGIAKACHEQGAELAFSYVGERFKDRITDFAAEFNSQLVFDCDVARDEQIARMIADLSQTWPKLWRSPPTDCRPPSGCGPRRAFTTGNRCWPRT